MEKAQLVPILNKQTGDLVYTYKKVSDIELEKIKKKVFIQQCKIISRKIGLKDEITRMINNESR